jgi:hypothetical protein
LSEEITTKNIIIAEKVIIVDDGSQNKNNLE